MQIPRLVVAALSALGVAVLAACGGGSTTITERETQTVNVTVRADGTPYHPVQDTSWPAGAPWSKGGAQHIMSGLAAAVGRAPQVTYVALYDGYVIVTVLDDRDPRRQDNWSWRDGKWSSNALSNDDPQRLRELAFTPNTDWFSVIDGLVARAPALASDIEEGQLSLIALSRDASRDDQLTWTVSISGPRDSGVYRFGLDGGVLHGG